MSPDATTLRLRSGRRAPHPKELEPPEPGVSAGHWAHRMHEVRGDPGGLAEELALVPAS
jgi:hypothetical protein